MDKVMGKIAKKNKPKCGICGKTTKLKKTECCGQWICNDWNPGSTLALATNSCSHNHTRLTLCGHHYAFKHPGDVNTCLLCKNAFEEELYAYLKTNEYNFNVNGKSANKKLPVLSLQTNSDEAIGKCTQCNKVINLVDDSYTIKGNDYFCVDCMPLF